MRLHGKPCTSTVDRGRHKREHQSKPNLAEGPSYQFGCFRSNCSSDAIWLFDLLAADSDHVAFMTTNILFLGGPKNEFVQDVAYADRFRFML